MTDKNELMPCPETIDVVITNTGALYIRDEPKENYSSSVRFVTYTRANTRHVPSGRAVEMYLCEINRLFLKPNQAYIFIEHPDCNQCKKYALAACSTVDEEKEEYRTGLYVLSRQLQSFLDGKTTPAEQFIPVLIDNINLILQHPSTKGESHD